MNSKPTHANYVVAVCLAHDYHSRKDESLPCPLCERAARIAAEARLAEAVRLLSVAHDQMFSWFSSEYAEHPKTKALAKFLATIST